MFFPNIKQHLCLNILYSKGRVGVSEASLEKLISPSDQIPMINISSRARRPPLPQIFLNLPIHSTATIDDKYRHGSQWVETVRKVAEAAPAVQTVVCSTFSPRFSFPNRPRLG